MDELLQYPALDARRPAASYPADLQKVMHLVAFNPEAVIHYGSGAKRAFFLSASDLDLMQKVNLSQADALTRRLQAIVANLVSQPYTWFVELKAGEDAMLRPDPSLIGSYKEGIDRPGLRAFVLSRPFTHKEEILRLLRKKTITGKAWFALQELLRSDYVLRWSRQEVEAGQKVLPRGAVVSLEDAVRDTHAMCQLDAIAFVPSMNKLTEVTNYNTIP